MRIQALASTVSDNFFYLAIDGTDGVLVDPIDPKVAIAAVKDAGLERVRILATHGHPDHIDGNGAVKEALGCEVIAPSHAKTFSIPHDTQVSGGDTITVGDASLEILYAPGHTDGHIVAYTPGHLISGDVYFVAGAGNCRWGGDPCELHKTYTERLGHLPDDTLFYPGHDYAARNIEFILSTNPDNAAAKARLERAQSWTRDQGPLLTTLGEERAYNPFHQTGDAAVQAQLFERYPDREADCADPSERAFRILRGLRDVF